MSTFLEDTKDEIKNSGHIVENIVFIGSEESGHSCTWNKFKKLADEEYDAGFGSSQVALDLIIVFSDGIVMRRGEYDGSEWWEYNKPFERPKKCKKIKCLFAIEIGWESLEDINEKEENVEEKN